MCRTAAQNAIREAARQGLLVVQERRREGRRNDANVVRIISAEWKAWIVRGVGLRQRLLGRRPAPKALNRDDVIGGEWE